MKKYLPETIKKCYNLTAEQYSQTFLHELEQKPLDQYLLKRFSSLISKNGLILDFGCGSGQTTKFLYDLGHRKITGLDFAEESIKKAKEIFPKIRFDIDNMLNSKFKSESADGILAFYAIVHFTYKEISAALSEWERLLKPDGKLLFSFHIGNRSVKVKNFLNVNGADAVWNLFNPDKIINIILEKKYFINEALIRHPYENAEHPSKRCYILLSKKN